MIKDIKKHAVLLVALALAVFLVVGLSTRSHSHRTSPHSATFGLPPKWYKPSTNVFGVPTVEMYDTITLSTIPANPKLLAGYTAGSWPTYLPLVHAYPHARVISIAIGARYHAMCLDVEPGDAVPSEVPAWIRSDIAAGFKRPCVYSSLSEWTTIGAYIRAAHIARNVYWAWDANWTYRAHLDVNFDATQWTDHAFGRNLDESTVTLAFAGLQPPPKPKPHLVCFGPKAQLKNIKCKEVRPELAQLTREVAAGKKTVARLNAQLKSIAGQLSGATKTLNSQQAGINTIVREYF